MEKLSVGAFETQWYQINVSQHTTFIQLITLLTIVSTKNMRIFFMYIKGNVKLF